MDDFDWLSGDDYDLTDSYDGGDYDSGWGENSIFDDSGGGYDIPADEWDNPGDDYSWMDDTSSGFDMGGTSGGGESSSDGGGVLGGAASGAAAGAAFGPWGALIGAGLGAVSSYFGGKAKDKQSKEDFERQKELYAFKLAEDEKYYQAHGKQLSDAYGKYKQYYKPPGSSKPTEQFGLLAGSGGPSGYFE